MTRSLALAAALVLCATGGAHAQTGLRPGGLAFDADSADFNAAACTTTLRGRVEIVQEGVRLRAGNVVLNFPQGNDCSGSPTRLRASGEVFYVTPDQTVRADTADYDFGSEVVIFTGNVIAVQGEEVSTAQRMVYNTATESLEMTGGVRGVVILEEDDTGQ